MIDFVRRVKNCNIVHSTYLVQCGALWTACRSIMNRTKVNFPNLCTFCSPEKRESLGFVSGYHSAGNATGIKALVIHAFALFSKRMNDSQTITNICVLVCQSEMIGNTMTERLLQIIQFTEHIQYGDSDIIIYPNIQFSEAIFAYKVLEFQQKLW